MYWFYGDRVWNCYWVHFINFWQSYPPWDTIMAGYYCFTFLFKDTMGILWTPLSIRPSRNLLLNHRAEFNQTCYMTSPHGKGVQEQHYVSSIRPSVQRPSICLSCYLFLNHWMEFNQTCYMTSLMVRYCESNIIFPPSIHLASVCQSICLSHCLLPNHWVEFNQTCYMISPHGKGVREWVTQHMFLWSTKTKIFI